MSNCESCGCQGNIVEIVYDATQHGTQTQPQTVTVSASPAEENQIENDDKPP